LGVGGGVGQQGGHVLEVLADLGHHPKAAAVAGPGDPVGDQPGQLPRGGQVLHLPLQPRNLSGGDLGGGIQPLALLLAEPLGRLPHRTGTRPGRTDEAADQPVDRQEAGDAGHRQDPLRHRR
jgi:hypothetical protein